MFTLNKKLLAIVLTFLSFPLFLHAEHVTVQLHFAITEATEAEEPKVIDDHLVLTYKGNRHYRFVGAAFRHEDFKMIHPFYVNTNGVYILTYPLSEGMSNLEYRLVVDGLWMTDPHNNQRAIDNEGISLSSFMIPEKEGPPESPRSDDNAITFQYIGAQGQRVYLYGDFNNWDPYMYRMAEESGTGSYTCRLRLSPGTYRYKFIVDGTSMPDPLNDEKILDGFGDTASKFTVSSRY